jgi:hypothetical protein
VLLDAKPLPTPTRFAIVVPSQFSSKDVKAVVGIVEMTAGSDAPEHAQLVAQAQQQLTTPAVVQAPMPTTRENGLSAALQSLQRKETSRLAMIYLASETGATLLGDVALVGQGEAINELASRIVERGESLQSLDRPQLGWQFDRITLEQLAAIQSADKLPGELKGILARVAGEAARNAGSLEELTRVGGREQFEARLIAENFTYLEDASASSRVRAYDWLNARGRAPANYDPLGPAKQRAAAVEAAITAQAQPAKSTGGAP